MGEDFGFRTGWLFGAGWYEEVLVFVRGLQHLNLLGREAGCLGYGLNGNVLLQ